MAKDHVGYVDFDGRFVRMRDARCWFSGGQLDVEAEGPRCKVRLYGILFPEVGGIPDLQGRECVIDPEIVQGDPFAEGGVETKEMWLAYRTLAVRCRSFDAEASLITVTFQAEVEDVHSGRTGSVDCSVRCSIVERPW